MFQLFLQLSTLKKKKARFSRTYANQQAVHTGAILFILIRFAWVPMDFSVTIPRSNRPRSFIIEKQYCAHFSIVVKECTEVIGLTSIFTLLVSRYSRWQHSAAASNRRLFFEKIQISWKFVSLLLCRGDFAHMPTSCELWKSKFFRLHPPYFRFYRICSGLPEFVAAFLFILHGFVCFYYTFRVSCFPVYSTLLRV